MPKHLAISKIQYSINHADVLHLLIGCKTVLMDCIKKQPESLYATFPKLTSSHAFPASSTNFKFSDFSRQVAVLTTILFNLNTC